MIESFPTPLHSFWMLKQMEFITCNNVRCRQSFRTASTTALCLWESNLPRGNSTRPHFLPSCFSKVLYFAENREKVQMRNGGYAGCFKAPAQWSPLQRWPTGLWGTGIPFLSHRLRTHLCSHCFCTEKMTDFVFKISQCFRLCDGKILPDAGAGWASVQPTRF